MVPSRLTAGPPNLRLLDGFIGLWLVLWVTLGALTAVSLWQLSGLGDTVTTSGQAIVSSGEALESVGSVPVVGERPADLGRQVQSAGAEVSARGQDVKGQLRRLAVLLGLAIALLPTTPVLWARLRYHSWSAPPADDAAADTRAAVNR